MGKRVSKFSMCGCDGDTFRPELESRLTDRSIPNTEPAPLPFEQETPDRQKQSFHSKLPLKEFDSSEPMSNRPPKLPAVVKRQLSPIMMPHLRLPFRSTRSGPDSSASSDQDIAENPSMMTVKSNSPECSGATNCTSKSIKESYILGHTSEASDYLYD